MKEFFYCIFHGKYGLKFADSGILLAEFHYQSIPFWFLGFIFNLVLKYIWSPKEFIECHFLIEFYTVSFVLDCICHARVLFSQMRNLLQVHLHLRISFR